ncbi:hypothetical protein G7007_08080 [Pseudomonas entomophila]|uniref:hypothetical protein n=1 Tax=Pseudomonas entomophila TaxID=312306 RepID=UPI0015E485F2|nr:hypothetical protein [Pseudomonas entomophila]MBA1192816.1 hypothetical protein [Pseudomonas entomophila]
MTATAEMLFNIQRFQLLALFANPAAKANISPAYAYAWDRGIYPYGNDGASWHTPYKEQFRVNEAQVGELAEFLDTLWTSGKTITFYELESHYKVNGSARPGPVWDRAGLIGACRYFFLLEWFDEDFWKGLIGHSQCPTESKSISRPFTQDDLYFL